MKLSIVQYAAVLEAMRKLGESRGAEKRQCNRVEVQAKVQLATFKPDSTTAIDRQFAAITRDVSMTGVGLLQAIPVEVGNQFVALLPTLQKAPIYVICKSVFCRMLVDSVYNIGGIFVSEASAEIIAQLKTAPPVAAPPLSKAG